MLGLTFDPTQRFSAVTRSRPSSTGLRGPVPDALRWCWWTAGRQRLRQDEGLELLAAWAATAELDISPIRPVATEALDHP